MPIRVAIVEDDNLVRESLAVLIGGASGFQCVGAHASGEQALAGELVPRPNLARTYREVAEGGADLLYHGELGRRICRAVQEAGGWLTEADLVAFKPTWVTPLSIEYRGRTIQTVPPPSLGLQYLECLKILEAFDLVELRHNSTEYLHLLLETIKLASADRTRWSREEQPTIQALISAE